MDGQFSLPHWARQILIGLGLFLTGAVFAFGYSYRPLHGALTWKVDQLETRLDERNRENVELRDRIATLASKDENRIDPDTLEQVKRELEQTQRVLQKTEKDLERTDRERKQASSSASSWRKRFEELRNATPSAPSIAAIGPQPPTVDRDSADASRPAAPDPSATDSSAPAFNEGSPGVDERDGFFEPDGATPTAP
jgi:hypothetical protein